MSVFIFIPNKKYNIFQRWYSILGAILCFIIISLIEDLSFTWIIDIISVLNFIGVFLFILWLYFVFSSINEKEKLNGILNGEIKLTKDGIFINEDFYNLREISKISLLSDDYEEKYNHFLINTCYPKKSIGVINYFKIELKNGTVREVQFKQNYEDEFIKKNKQMLINYSKEEVISFLALTEMLKIDDYDEIQKIKQFY